jgi:hypothetical protein
MEHISCNNNVFMLYFNCGLTMVKKCFTIQFQREGYIFTFTVWGNKNFQMFNLKTFSNTIKKVMSNKV